MVPVIKKKSGDVRICVDLKHLNESIVRERYIIPSKDEILGQLAGAAVFSSLDAESGFWQIPLDEESQKMTTFITPFGRYCYQRLPFGISSAPEIFQRKMSELFKDMDGVVVYLDDVLVFGSTVEEHDACLAKVLEVVKASSLKLNDAKCVYRQTKLKFLGHIISKDGIAVDGDKVSAIRKLAPPTNVTELKRILGMVNYLAAHVDNLATILEPMYKLLKNDVCWCWG